MPLCWRPGLRFSSRENPMIARCDCGFGGADEQRGCCSIGAAAIATVMEKLSEDVSFRRVRVLQGLSRKQRIEGVLTPTPWRLTD